MTKPQLEPTETPDERRKRLRREAHKRWRLRHPEKVAGQNHRYRVAHLDYFADKQRQYQQERWTAYHALKATLSCAKCGSKDGLEFHHKNPDEKYETAVRTGNRGHISSLVSSMPHSRLLEEIAKCVILCAKCHRRLHVYCEQLVLQQFITEK